MMSMKNLHNKLTDLPLKEMDGSLLAGAILFEAGATGKVDMGLLSDAILVASYLHRDDTRQNRKNLPRDTYITHPLRNTLRLIRYGVISTDILVACVLHDTVEDHPAEIVADLSSYGVVDPEDKNSVRTQALQALADHFGVIVSHLVEQVSNPIPAPGVQLSKDEKRAEYLKHVSHVVHNNYPVFLVKFADFYDNAGSLHHTVKGNENMTSHLVKKYTPLVKVFRDELPYVKNHVSSEGFAQIVAHLDAVKNRLISLGAVLD